AAGGVARRGTEIEVSRSADSIITCPKGGERTSEGIRRDAWGFFYACKGCGKAPAPPPPMPRSAATCRGRPCSTALRPGAVAATAPGAETDAWWKASLLRPIGQ